MKGKLDQILRDKYNDVKLKKDFRLDIPEKSNGYKRIYKLAACVILFCMVIYGIYYTNFKDINIANENNIQNKPINTANNNGQKTGEKELPIATETIIIDSTYDIGNLLKSGDAEHIVIAKISKILGYTNYIEKLGVYTGVPITIIEATPIKVLKGNMSKNFKFIKSGGIISFSDYEKTLLPEQIQKQGLDKKSKTEKENTYIECLPPFELKVPTVEADKTYLLCLRYSENFEMQTTSGFIRGICEYDEQTRKIKNINTGEWEEIDLSKL
ncbi:MAG: hypothetical protein N2749_04425 [Clostridia bacterium]|nr:hypothetical protein [Clostridia bacterium]